MKSKNHQALISFLKIIEGISSKEYQKRVWIEGSGPECDDFDETVNCFFDNGRPILENFKHYDITEDQYSILNFFFNMFEAFSDEHDWPAEFIDTPEWTKITEMAKEVLKAFHWKTPDQD